MKILFLCVKGERERGVLGSRMTSCILPAAHALNLIDSQANRVTLHAVFQGLNAQLLTISQEKNTLVSELIALQDNFIQEQSTTTVLMFLTDACVLQLIDRPFCRV